MSIFCFLDLERMKKNKPVTIIMIALLGASLLTGCTSVTGMADVQMFIETEAAAASFDNKEDLDDIDATESDAYEISSNGDSRVVIQLSGNTASSNGSAVAIKGSNITIPASGEYEITGTLTNGSILVNVDKSTDKGLVKIVLNDAQINSETSAPIYIIDANEVMLALADGSNNGIIQGNGVKVNEDEEPTAAIFSKSDLTIAGAGKLLVRTSFKDGITSRDHLMITGGNIAIDAASDAIVGKDSVDILNASLTITAGKDGIRSTSDADEGRGNITIHNGTFKITAANDGIQAYSNLYIKDGDFDITTGGGYPGRSISSGNEGFGRIPGQAFVTAQANVKDTEESKKGLKSTGKVIIEGGVIKVSSYDDAIHSNDEIAINGGNLNIQSGDDAMHADNILTINSGQVNIENSYEGLEANQIIINGGKLSIASSDDGINVNQNTGQLTINDGSVSIVADEDGIDSNGNIVMSGGLVYVDGPTASMNGSIDYNGRFTISGGTLVASGSSGMAQAPSSDSTQPSILMYYGTSQAAGTTISLKDLTGLQIAGFTPKKSYSSVVISAPSLAIGSSYLLYAGSSKIVDIALAGIVSAMSESGVIAQGTGPGGKVGGQFAPPGGFIGKPPRN